MVVVPVKREEGEYHHSSKMGELTCTHKRPVSLWNFKPVRNCFRIIRLNRCSQNGLRKTCSQTEVTKKIFCLETWSFWMKLCNPLMISLQLRFYLAWCRNHPISATISWIDARRGDVDRQAQWGKMRKIAPLLLKMRCKLLFVAEIKFYPNSKEARQEYWMPRRGTEGMWKQSLYGFSWDFYPKTWYCGIVSRNIHWKNATDGMLWKEILKKLWRAQWCLFTVSFLLAFALFLFRNGKWPGITKSLTENVALVAPLSNATSDNLINIYSDKVR